MATNVLGGRSLVAIGLAASFTLAATPASTAAEFVIEEPGTMGALVLQPLTDGFLTSFRIRGTELVSGVCAFGVFQADNPLNPLIGYAFDESTKIRINAYATSGGGEMVPALTALRTFSEELDGVSHQQAMDNEVNAFKMIGAQVVLGPAAEATIGAGATATFDMVIDKPARLGYLIVSPTASGLLVDEVKIQSDNLINGKPASQLFTPASQVSPGFGHRVTTSTKLRVIMRNALGIGAIADVCPNFLLLDADTSAAQLASRLRTVAANAA